jgi:hypothetical protein
MVARSRVRDLHPLMWVAGVLFIGFFTADWLSAHVF